MTTKPVDLYAAALAVLNNSHSPYSNFKVAAAVRTADGNIYPGVNVENVSYPLGCCAEQNAISTMVCNGETKITEILVLVPGPAICTPCGGCRQNIAEFADSDCVVHLCTIQESKHQPTTLGELLPGAFSNPA